MSNKVSYIMVMQDRYSRIAEKARRVTNSLSQSMRNAGLAAKMLGNRYTELRKKTKSYSDGLKSAGQKMTLFATTPLLLLAHNMKNAARDAGETESKFSVVFSSISNKANKVASDLAKNYSLAGSQSKKLLSDTGDLLTGFGFTQESALELSNEVNKLARDLESFTNYSGGVEGASQALTKALLGERESIKSLGISILEEDVKRRVQLLLAKGMTFATLRQAKAFATLQLAQEQSKNAIGDYARTQKDLANQEREFSARILNLKEKFGRLLIPIMEKLLIVGNKIIDWFDSMSPAAQKTTLIILGVVAVIGPLLLGLAGLLAIVPAVVTGFGLIAGVVGAISLPVLGVIAGITALGVALTALYNNWDTVSMYIGDGIDFILDKAIKLITLPDRISKAVAGFLGFGKDTEASVNINKRSESIVSGGAKNQTDVNLNIKAPKNIIESVKAKTTGKPNGLNLGVNMATEQ